MKCIAAVLAVALLVAACGGSSYSSSTSTAATAVDWNAIYTRDAPGVVTVISVFGSAAAGGLTVQGSGFVVTTSGEVVTNAHVVSTSVGSALHRANHVYVQFADGNEVPATILGA